MPARFADIKFNLMRAIELFEDMNSMDMDVTAPLSAPNSYKEIEVAQRLNIYLGQLIDEGIFDECELRDDSLDEDDEEGSDDGQEISSSEPPRSEGFDYDSNRSGPESGSLEADDRGSRESFTDRFKRYIRRIIPGTRRRSDSQQQQQPDGGHDEHDHHHHHHHHDDHDDAPHEQHHERSGSESGPIRPMNATISTGSYEDEEYDQQGEGIYDPSSTSYDGSESVHDGHPIHRHHRRASASTINSSQASDSARDSGSESELDDAPLSPRSRSTSRTSTLSRRTSSASSRRSGSRAGSRASSRTGRARSANSRGGARSRTSSRRRRRSSAASRSSRRSSAGRRSR